MEPLPVKYGESGTMTSAGDLGEVGDVEGGGADLGQEREAVGAQARRRAR